MWQNLIVILIVAAAAAWVAQRFWRSARGKGPACCGGSEHGPCTGCPPAAPQTLDQLNPPADCPHCHPAAPAGPPASAPENEKS